MSIAFIDLETQQSTRKHPLKDEHYTDIGNPFNSDSSVVCTGVYRKGDGYSHHQGVDNLSLDDVDYLVGHNIKYDLLWLRACGYDVFKHKFIDTMLLEAVRSCGKYGDMQPLMVSLDNSCKRAGLPGKVDVPKILWARGLKTEDIPSKILHNYLKGDVWNTYALFAHLKKDPLLLEQKEFAQFIHEVLRVVLEMEYNGCKFNDEDDEDVRKELQQGVADAERSLWDKLLPVLGKSFDHNSLADRKTKVIDSPKFMAEAFYSLKVKPGCEKEFSRFSSRWKPWKYGAGNELKQAISEYCEKLPYGANVRPDLAWLQMAQPTKNQFIGKSGFLVNSKLLSAFVEYGKPNKRQHELATAIMEYSKASTWLNTNYSGVIKGLRDDGFIHGSFNQAGTVTFRFSSSDPNMQNWPREGTMPLKRLIKSRYEGGSIVSADYSQLEFCVAGWLSGDKALIEDVTVGFDIHTHTAKMAFGKKWEEAEGKPEVRKELRRMAKTSTFAFQYGAMPKNQVQQAIYDAFYGKYSTLAAWQREQCAIIATHQRYVCPKTGKIFMFEGANFSNQISWSTRAKNYPVQYLTAALVQAAMLEVRSRLPDDVKMILQVHDSIVLDSPPEALDKAKHALYHGMVEAEKTFLKFFGKKVDVPLKVELSTGPDYYNQTIVKEVP